MVQGALMLAEGVLVGPEIGEPFLQKALQPGVGPGVIEGNPQRPQRTCQATAKTGPEATRKLVHPVERGNKTGKASGAAPSLEPMALELAVQTPQDVEAMRRLAAAGWGRRRIAKELGCSPETVRKYLRQGGWQPYGKPCRSRQNHGE